MPGKRRLSACRGAYEPHVGFYDLHQVLEILSSFEGNSLQRNRTETISGSDPIDAQPRWLGQGCG